MQKAGAAHSKLATEAADGRGVDRHLYGLFCVNTCSVLVLTTDGQTPSGLKKLLKEGEKLPAIYADPTFGQSSNWILSTSQLTSEFFEGWGYGEGERFSFPPHHSIH